jgi:Tol biopolymer transport system component
MTRIALASFVLGFAAACTTARAQSTTRVDEGPSGAEASTGVRFESDVSADGRFVVFSTTSPLAPGDSDSVEDVVLFDRNFGRLELVSVRSDGVKGDGDSLEPSVSDDGRFVAFSSRAANFPHGSPAADPDCYVRDRSTGQTVRITADTATRFADAPSLSADGRFVAYRGDGFGAAIHDRDADGDGIFDQAGGTSTTACSAIDGGIAFTGFPKLSGDGRWCTFDSSSAALSPDLYVCDQDPNSTTICRSVWVFDLLTSTRTRVNVDSAGALLPGDCNAPTISDDGRYVVFTNGGTQFPSGTHPPFAHLHDRDADGNGTYDEPGGISTRIAVRNLQGEVREGWGELSPDGRYVAFASSATDLVPSLPPGPTGPSIDQTYVLDLRTRVVELVSASMDGRLGDATSSPVAVTPGGRFVLFQSSASDLISHDTNGTFDLFVRDREPCRPGNVNAARESVADVLRVNGSSGTPGDRLVTVAAHAPISVSLVASPAGPPTPRYVVWAWRRAPQAQFFVTVGGERIGCSVNPTPDRPQATPPLPIACLLGGLDPSLCGPVGVHRASPSRAPWTRTRAAGFPTGTALTLQGIVEDEGSTATIGLSMTNAVIVEVQ